MSRILITGATGFIGRHLIASLEKNHELSALIRPGFKAELPQGTFWIEQDLAQDLDYSILPEHLDAIIHLAQSKFYRQLNDKSSDVFKINVESTFRLLEYGKMTGIHHFMLASTGGVYGVNSQNVLETNPVNPSDFYTASKYCAELLTNSYKHIFKTVIFRFFFPYGPGQTDRLISNLIQKIMAEIPIEIEGNPGIRINPIYVQDLIRVFAPALKLNSSGLFNVAGDEVVTLKELIQIMEHITRLKATVHHTQGSSQGDLIGDNARMKKLLNVFPTTSLAQGLEQMIQAASGRIKH